MKFQQLYSSSFGNLYMVTAANGKRLMIECGVPWAKLQEALDYNLGGIVGCLVSHEHADHSKAVKKVMQAGIDVYSDCDTLDVLDVLDNHRAIPTPSQTLLRLDSFEVLFFPVNHDAVQPLGFIIRVKESHKFLLFATDTSHITQRFKVPFSIIAIECSYDKDVLQKRVDTKDIDESLARRLLTSHMEKREAMRYLSEFCDLSKCREIHLLHMSGDNLDKEQTKTEFEKKFFIETRIK